MSPAAGEHSGEPARHPFSRFLRAVLLFDLTLLAVVVGVCAWNGWTAPHEFARALLLAGGIEIVLAIAPSIAMTSLESTGYWGRGLFGQGLGFSYRAYEEDEGLRSGLTRWVAFLLVAGVILFAFGGGLFFLS